MPSPFPGMDPYLERPGFWSSMHARLINYTAEHLQPQLLPRYVANIEERVYLEPVSRERIPDEAYIEILDLAGHEVVTVIEVLSPTNKAPGPGRDAYRAKQQQVLYSTANLVEIDLLRCGLDTVVAPAEEIARCGPADYLICTRRVARPGGFEVVRFTMRDPLPLVAIPLRAGENDVVLHLPEVFTRCYEVGAYAYRIDYTQAPDPPLLPDDAAWAEELLRRQGLR